DPFDFTLSNGATPYGRIRPRKALPPFQGLRDGGCRNVGERGEVQHRIGVTHLLLAVHKTGIAERGATGRENTWQIENAEWFSPTRAVQNGRVSSRGKIFREAQPNDGIRGTLPQQLLGDLRHSNGRARRG